MSKSFIDFIYLCFRRYSLENMLIMSARFTNRTCRKKSPISFTKNTPNVLKNQMKLFKKKWQNFTAAVRTAVRNVNDGLTATGNF